MVEPSAGAVAPPVRGDRRSRTTEALSGAEGLSDAGALGAAVVRQCRDPLQVAAWRRGPELHFHHHDLWHAGRYHAIGTGAGDVLPGGRTDRPADAGDGGELGLARGIARRLQPRASFA